MAPVKRGRNGEFKMSAKRSLGTTQSLTFIGALLVTTAFTVPAFAQIETVVVTAEKKAEDIQTTPIAVTAYSAQDLAAHQVNGFKDIQFSTPNVTYTKANFTGTNFQIRGIGTQVISGDAESGIAFNIDDVYYANAPVDSGQFYDHAIASKSCAARRARCMAAARPAARSTCSPPSRKLDAFAASIDASYGTYDTSEVKGMVNMPIVTDELGVRVAGRLGTSRRLRDQHRSDCRRPSPRLPRSVVGPRLDPLAAVPGHDGRSHLLARQRRRHAHARREAALPHRPDGHAGLLA